MTRKPGDHGDHDGNHPHHHNPPPVNPPPVNPQPVTEQTINVKITFYGWPDNSPPGNGIAYPTASRPHAGGIGTYENPITAAVAKGSTLMLPGTIIYVPTLSKYVRVDDECGSCTVNNWIDIWVESNAGSDTNAVLAREDELTGDDKVMRPIIVNPPRNLTVNATPLF